MKKNKGENNIINNIIKIIIILLTIVLQIISFFFLYGATSTLSEYAKIIFEIIKFISVIYIYYVEKSISCQSRLYLQKLLMYLMRVFFKLIK